MRKITVSIIAASALAMTAAACTPYQKHRDMQKHAYYNYDATSHNITRSARLNTNKHVTKVASVAKAKGEQNLRKINTFYFGLDKDAVAVKDDAVIKAHAEYLKAHQNSHVRVEGHADERGNPQYNIGLGKRRANAVKDALVKNGVNPEQVQVVSYGITKPSVSGHTEKAWAKNRRTEIVYDKS